MKRQSSASRHHRKAGPVGRGFTLVELMLAVAMLAVIGLAVASLTVSATSGWAEQKQQSHSTTALSRVSAVLGRTFGEATAAWLPADVPDESVDVDRLIVAWNDGAHNTKGRDFVSQFGEITVIRYRASTDTIEMTVADKSATLNDTAQSQANLVLTNSHIANLESTATAFENLNWTVTHTIAGTAAEPITKAYFSRETNASGSQYVSWTIGSFNGTTAHATSDGRQLNGYVSSTNVTEYQQRQNLAASRGYSSKMPEISSTPAPETTPPPTGREEEEDG